MNQRTEAITSILLNLKRNTDEVEVVLRSQKKHAKLMLTLRVLLKIQQSSRSTGREKLQQSGCLSRAATRPGHFQ